MKAKTIKSPLLIDTIQRYLLFIIGLFFSALGVAITKKGELGVSPISSVANVMSIRLPQLSLGYWLIIWNCVLILGQILLLRRKFQWIQLLQVPLSFLFGWFTDFGVWMISFFTPKHYVVQILLVLAGTVVLGFGITLAAVLFGPVEGFAVGAVADMIGGTLSGYAINPLITLGAGSIGLTAGLLWRALPNLRLGLRTQISVFAGHAVGSIVINSLALHLFYNYPWSVLVTRIPNALVLAAVNTVLVRLLLENKTIRGIAQ